MARNDWATHRPIPRLAGHLENMETTMDKATGTATKTIVEAEMIIDKDVDIPMRDGLRLKADVIRPKAEGKYPVIMAMGVYHKDMGFHLGPEATPSKYPNFEVLSPEDYVPHGYVLVRVD